MDGLAAWIAWLACALGQDAPGAPLPAPWPQAWSDLALLSESVPGSPQYERIWHDLDGLQDRQDRSARKSRDPEAGYRARILRAQLSRLAGTPFRPVGDPGSTIRLHSGEAWLVLQVAGPGPLRVRAVRAALEESSGPDRSLRVEKALEAAEEDARNLRLDWAVDESRSVLDLARDRRGARLHARVLRLRGEFERSAQVLEVELRTATDAADRAALADDLGRVHLAAGEEERSVHDFASALALGSGEAAARMAYRALHVGETGRARALYRSLLGGEFARNGAWRGYGLALLAPPSGAGAVAARNIPDTSD